MPERGVSGFKFMECNQERRAHLRNSKGISVTDAKYVRASMMGEVVTETIRGQNTWLYRSLKYFSCQYE